MPPKENWVKVFDNIERIPFRENRIASIKIEDKIICIAETSFGLKAFSSTLPHAGGNLSEGFIDKKQNIICPVHGYRFSLNTGRDTNGEGYFLKIFPVKETVEGIFIKLE